MQHPVSVNTSETVEKLEHRAMVAIPLFLIMAAIQESQQHVQVVESDDVCICICITLNATGSHRGSARDWKIEEK